MYQRRRNDDIGREEPIPATRTSETLGSCSVLVFGLEFVLELCQKRQRLQRSELVGVDGVHPFGEMGIAGRWCTKKTELLSVVGGRRIRHAAERGTAAP